jgi:hypothetical protein
LSGVTWYEPLLINWVNIVMIEGDTSEIYGAIQKLEGSDETYKRISNEGKKTAVSLLNSEIHTAYVSNLMFISKLMGTINVNKQCELNSFASTNVKGERKEVKYNGKPTSKVMYNSSSTMTMLLMLNKTNSGTLYHEAILEGIKSALEEAFVQIALPGLKNSLDKTKLCEMFYKKMFGEVKSEMYSSLSDGEKIVISSRPIEVFLKLFREFNLNNKVQAGDLMRITVNLKRKLEKQELINHVFFLFSNTTTHELTKDNEYAEERINVSGEMVHTGLLNNNVMAISNKELICLEVNTQFSCLINNNMESVEMIKELKTTSPFYVRFS